MEKLMIIGLLLIIIGILFLIISGISLSLRENGIKKVDFAVGGFIGPIPFGFFTNKKMFWIWLGILIIGLIIWLIARRLL